MAEISWASCLSQVTTTFIFTLQLETWGGEGRGTESDTSARITAVQSQSSLPSVERDWDYIFTRSRPTRSRECDWSPLTSAFSIAVSAASPPPPSATPPAPPTPSPPTPTTCGSPSTNHKRGHRTDRDTFPSGDHSESQLCERRWRTFTNRVDWFASFIRACFSRSASCRPCCANLRASSSASRRWRSLSSASLRRSNS